LPVDRISVVENPLILKHLELSEQLKAPKKGQSWKLGFFGQINFYKGLDVILEGVRLAISQGLDVEVGIHGTFSSVTGEDYTAKLKEAIILLGSKARYHGPYKQNDVQSLMQQYHWIAMGSRWFENSPVVIQEAISASVPMIVPNHGGMLEKTSDFSMHYEPGVPSSFSNVLLKLSHEKFQENYKKVNKLKSTQNELNMKGFDFICNKYLA
jgi:glycosyltransferase involved in cell wall biosynthesis